ncbi:MAG: hypothetical protein ACLGHX_08935 [Acidimicrobiia bacterium]
MKVSVISGRWQGPWLRAAIAMIGGLAGIGVVVPGALGSFAASTAVLAVICVPFLRVIWIVYRFATEGDRRFVFVGVSLLSVAAFGVAVSLFLR